MKWAESISINTHYTRSIHLERDASSEDVIRAYIPTSRALKVLDALADTLHTGTVPRSWSLTGPYGSGKSSFAVFVSHLLADPESKEARLAMDVLRKANSGLAIKVLNQLQQPKGFCRILLTGSPDPLAKRLLLAIHQGIKTYQTNKRGRPPSVLRQVEQAITQENYSTGEIIEILKALKAAVAKSGGNGVLLVIDELGKFLEYEVRNFGANDIYLLQAIAELACDKGKAPICFFVLLHQSFEMYVKDLNVSLKNDWQKVQGRFESIPFLESAEQTLRVIRAAFIQNFDEGTKATVCSEAQLISQTLGEANALPGALDSDGAVALFSGCYPLHPVSLLLLPTLCQRVAQNERTLFSYLGSREAHGLNDSISRLSSKGKTLPWVYPWEIYEYFILNQPTSVSDHFTHRRWVEVVTAVERLGDSSDEEAHLLKTIGLMNIIGAKSGLKPSLEVLESCTPFGSKKTKALLSSLQKRSVITYRKYGGEYRVWQGSDFDLESELQDEIEKDRGLNLADELNNREALPPIVARRHTIETGSLRYFSPLFADVSSIKRIDGESTAPRILFLLAETPMEKELLLREAKNLGVGMTVAAVCSMGAEVRQIAQEVLALERINRSSPVLSGDPVAQRELKDRLHAARTKEMQVLESVLLNPEQHEWYYDNKSVQIISRRSLQTELSNILEKVYCKAPLIRNELINRTKPSSSAAFGRNKLLEAMLNNAAEPDLGIDKYPAEKAMYKSILEASKLHVLCDDKWKFVSPASDDPCRIKPVWDAMNAFFERTEGDPLSISELFEELMRQPYGVKAGLIPILFLTAYIVNQQDLALYEEGIFVPVLELEILARLIKNPHSFSIQCFRLAGMRMSIYKKYIETITGEKRQKNLLETARPIAKFLGGLPEYTKHTKTLSPKAIAVREAYQKSKSPADLLFTDLPIACGYSAFRSDEGSQVAAEEFSKTFIEVLRELKNAYPELLRTIQVKLNSAFPDCGAENLHQLRQDIRGRCLGLDHFTIDAEGLKAFILRLCDTHGDDEQWLEGLAAFLGRKPPAKWHDDDIQFVDFKLAELSKRLRDLEKLRLAYADNKDMATPGFEAILLRIVRQDVHELEHMVHINEKEKEIAKAVMPAIQEALDKLPTEHQQLALLTELIDGLLEQLQGRTPSQASASKKREET